MIEQIKYWAQIFMLPVYWFSFITPRNKKIWLFGSTFGRRFADNPRYLYLYVSQLKKRNIRAIWISHNKDVVELLNENGYKAYYYRSLKGIFYCLVAGVYIFDNYSKDISFWLSGGAKKVNLWHGTGNKKINYDNRFDKVRHPKNRFESFKYFLRRMSDEKPSHYVLATSKVMGEIFSSAFRVPKSHILVDGYPRNDMLFTNTKIENLYTKEEKNIVELAKAFKHIGQKIIVYMPTFRDSETKFFDVMNLEEFNNFLVKENIVFLTKLHPKSKLKKEFERVSYDNIYNIDADVDPYTFLGLADMLVTDYSSVYTDFLLLNKPSVFFTYDLKEYSKDTRDCYFDYDEYLPELRTYNMEQLMTGIKCVLISDNCELAREKLRDKMFNYCDCNSSERLVKKIMVLLEK